MERRVLLGSFLGTAIAPDQLRVKVNAAGSRFWINSEAEASARFERALEFKNGLERHVAGNQADFLYHAGIVSQLGLTAYLFGHGITDDWCRERIGLNVEKALAFANHLGLGCNCPRIAVLVQLLGNYGQWRMPFLPELPDVSRLQTGPLTKDVIRLIDQVELGLSS
jgi:hypothetical protein